MTNAILYARYSDEDLQSATSAQDQLRILRERANREGWCIIREEADHGMSGSIRNRPGFMAVLEAIGRGEADLVLAESLDRLSRDQEDMAWFHKRVKFAGARIVTLSQGEISPMHIGFDGTQSALFLDQLGEKVKRGQIGRVEVGRIPGGKAYGYKPLREFRDDGSFEGGRRTIDTDEARVIIRIFEAVSDGQSPRAIAAMLNQEGTPSPRGGIWRANTISGNRKRGNGILHNELYIGRIVYNRQSFRKEPDSRKRQARPNDQSAWRVKDVPDLRIVDQELWSRAHAALRPYQTSEKLTRRPKKLLSGKLRCGLCGGRMNIIGNDRWGCFSHKEEGICSNGKTISNHIVEAKVWAAMQSQWLHPDAIAAYVDQFQKTANEAQRQRKKNRSDIDSRLAQIDIEQERIVDAVGSGVDPAKLGARSTALSAETQSLLRQRDNIDAEEDVIIHPNIAQAYRLRISSLKLLIDDDGEGALGARNMIRSMIEIITCTPRSDEDQSETKPHRGKNWRAGSGMELTLQGELAQILRIAANQRPKPTLGLADFQADTLAVVAGVGFEPTTFRL
jgi:site-specific DNA recombinase